jgi:hypothetical protein
MKKEEKNWRLIKSQYKRLFNIPTDIIDKVAVEEILRLSCSGLSNEDISSSLDYDTKYIEGTLLTYLRFAGWSETLDINPLLLYNSNRVKKDFLNIVKDNGEIAWEICSRYTKIEERIKRFYDNS